MKKKIELTVSELLEMRKQGYSNKDIAAFLDVSVATIYNYIGKAGRRMPSVTGGTLKRQSEKPTEAKTQIQIVSQTVAVGGYLFLINAADKSVTVSLPEQEQTIHLQADEIDKFKAALSSVQEFVYAQDKRGGLNGN